MSRCLCGSNKKVKDQKSQRPAEMLAEPRQFIDHSGLDWTHVKRTRYYCYQRFQYAYPGPVRNLHQKLVVVPVDQYGDQHLRDYQLSVSPYPADSRHDIDCFGNRIFKLDVRWIDRTIAFEVRAAVERTAGAQAVPSVPREQAGCFLSPTRLTASNAQIDAVARKLAEKTSKPEELAQAISDWVAGAL